MAHHYEDEIPPFIPRLKSLNDRYEEVRDALDNAETALEVDAIFENLKSTTNPKTVKFVAEKLDEEQEAQFSKNQKEDPISPSERKKGLAEVKKAEAWTDPDKIAELQEAIDEVQTFAQIILNIAKIRGDEASPLTKAIMEEMKKLSTEEYNSAYGLTQAILNVSDKLAPAKPAPKANPFAALDKPPKAA